MFHSFWLWLPFVLIQISVNILLCFKPASNASDPGVCDGSFYLCSLSQLFCIQRFSSTRQGVVQEEEGWEHGIKLRTCVPSWGLPSWLGTRPSVQNLSALSLKKTDIAQEMTQCLYPPPRHLCEDECLSSLCTESQPYFHPDSNLQLDTVKIQCINNMQLFLTDCTERQHMLVCRDASAGALHTPFFCLRLTIYCLS